MTSKLLALLLVALTLLPTLIACSSDTPSGDMSTSADTNATESTTATETAAPGDDIPDYNADGTAFTVYARRSAPYGGEFNATEEIGDTINDAVYRRNLIVEERLNTDVVYFDAGDDYQPFY